MQSSSGFSTKMKVVVTGYQGKMHSGWTCPPLGPLDAQLKMVNLVKHEMDEILESVVRRRRSDSFPRYSSADDDDVDDEMGDKVDFKAKPSIFD
jgi:hypothetical protein